MSTPNQPTRPTEQDYRDAFETYKVISQDWSVVPERCAQSSAKGRPESEDKKSPYDRPMPAVVNVEEIAKMLNIDANMPIPAVVNVRELAEQLGLAPRSKE